MSLALILIGVFLSPYILWLFIIDEWTVPHWESVWLAVSTSIFQAFLSAALSVLAGLLLVPFLLGQPEGRTLRVQEAGLLFVNIVPPLFLALSLLSWSQWLHLPGFGLATVVIAHAVLNCGLVAVALHRVLRERASTVIEVAWTMGASPLTIWYRVVSPLLWRELLALFFFVFSLCLTSFSLPLILSGARAVSLEVAIFEAIRVNGDWGIAVGLALVQSVVVLVFSYLLPKPQGRRLSSGASGIQTLAWPGSWWVLSLPAAILLIGWMGGLRISALATFIEASGVGQRHLFSTIFTSLTIGLAVGVNHLVLTLLILLSGPSRVLMKFMNGYLAPSPALIGFGLLVFPLSFPGSDMFKLIVALTLVIFPFIYRGLLQSEFLALSRQMDVARVLGSRSTSTAFRIVLPQILDAVMRGCGIAAIWASGDFALSGIFINRTATLPLLIQEWVQNYWIDQALWLLIPLFMVGVVCYGFFVLSTRFLRAEI